MKRFMFTSLVVIFIALAIPATAFAGGFEDGRVVFGTNYILESGEVLDGDLAVIGGSATLEEGSLVTGAVFLVGGDIFAAGEIKGDLVVVGGNASFGSNAVVGGDLVTLGGNVNTGTARIEGEVFSETEFDFPMNLKFDRDWGFPFTTVPTFRSSFAGSVLAYLFKSLMLAALAVLVLMFLPKHTQLVADTVVSQPVLAGALGLLTAFVAPILFILLLITICFSIVGILGAVVLAAAWGLGMIAMGLEVGNRLSKATNQEFQPVVAAGLGTLILGLVVFGIGLIPCVGWTVPFLVGTIGTGAVLMTRFGRQEYGVEAPPDEKPKLPAKKTSTAEKKTSSTAKKTSSTAKKKK
ncbi:MAG: hypothetical protein WBB65_14255 [Anaerolineales bacterium]